MRIDSNSASLGCVGKTKAIPATAAKLSWKDTWPNTLGSIPTMIAAANDNAGSTRRGRPNASAAKTVLPMIPARTTDAGIPLVKAYIHMTANGTRK